MTDYEYGYGVLSKKTQPASKDFKGTGGHEHEWRRPSWSDHVAGSFLQTGRKRYMRVHLDLNLSRRHFM